MCVSLCTCGCWPGREKDGCCEFCRRTRLSANSMRKGKHAVNKLLPFRSEKHNQCIPCRNYIAMRGLQEGPLRSTLRSNEVEYDAYLKGLAECSANRVFVPMTTHPFRPQSLSPMSNATHIRFGRQC